MLKHWHKLSEAERKALLRHYEFPASDFLISENLTHNDKYWGNASVVLAKVPFNYNKLEVNQKYFFPEHENVAETPYEYGKVVQAEGILGAMTYMVRAQNKIFEPSSLHPHFHLNCLIFFFVLPGSI